MIQGITRTALQTALRTGLGLALLLGVVGTSSDAFAQAADAKRGLKAQKEFYATPGMIDVEVRAMRGTLMITGSVPDEKLIAKADEIGGNVRGIKEVRNRLRVRPPIEANGVTDADLLAKIETKIEKDDDLKQARRRFEVEVSEGNVKLTGALPDYTTAQGLITDIRRIPGVQTIDFDKLKY